jgi:hypothetical protein
MNLWSNFCTQRILSLVLLVVMLASLIGCASEQSTQTKSQTVATAASASITTVTSVPKQAVSSSSVTGIPTPKAGWKRISVSSAGFSLDFPNSWDSVDLSSTDIDTMVANLVKRDKRWESMAGGLKDGYASGLKLVALDSSSQVGKSGIPVTMNVLVRTRSITLSNFAAENFNQLKQSGMISNEPIVDSVLLGNLQAKRFRYAFVFNGISNNMLQYDLVENGKTYVLTFGSDESLSRDLQPTFEAIASTFRLIQ